MSVHARRICSFFDFDAAAFDANYFNEGGFTVLVPKFLVGYPQTGSWHSKPKRKSQNSISMDAIMLRRVLLCRYYYLAWTPYASSLRIAVIAVDIDFAKIPLAMEVWRLCKFSFRAYRIFLLGAHRDQSYWIQGRRLRWWWPYKWGRGDGFQRTWRDLAHFRAESVRQG